jgi:hypothetical protein
VPNKDAEKVIEGYLGGPGRAEYAVNLLIKAGLIEDVPLSEPEILAEGAKKWLGYHGSTKDAFDKASGWSTDSWRIVMNDSYLDCDREYQFNTPWEIKWIFDALVILAKEAGVL